MPQESKPQSGLIPEHGWLTLQQAAALCGLSVDRLKAMIRSGELHALTVDRNGKQKFRIDRAALVDAGLMKVRQADDPAASFDLLTLIRDQNDRIARLEDQRAQLSGQLGIAVERLRSIDDRLRWIEEHESPTDPAPDPEERGDAPFMASESTSRLAPAIARLPQRPTVFMVRSFRRMADVTSRRRGSGSAPSEGDLS
jgi:excisionase family DNA binding protein